MRRGAFPRLAGRRHARSRHRHFGANLPAAVPKEVVRVAGQDFDEERSVTVIKSYLVNGRDRYRIDYRPQADGTVRMWALQRPRDPYRKSVTECHLYESGEICVAAGHEPRTLDRAKAIAVHWMEGWSVYVRTGDFPQGGRRISV